MVQLQALLAELAALDAEHDFDGLRRVRERIVEDHPASEAAAEALYKIGLDLLFRERNLDQAVAKFIEAAKCKHPYWSAAARTSLGLCYYHQQRGQKALFELRKVAYAKTASEHSVTALGFIENILTQEGKSDEAARARKDRIAQLEQLIAQSQASQGDVAARGHFLYQLGLALRDHDDGLRAKTVLEEAKALGPEGLGAALYASVVEALAE